MAVSYSETLLAILDACAQGGEELDADRAIQMLAAIAAALYWGLPALATDQRLQAAAARCLARVPQVRVQQGGLGPVCLLQVGSVHCSATLCCSRPLGHFACYI